MPSADVLLRLGSDMGARASDVYLHDPKYRKAFDIQYGAVVTKVVLFASASGRKTEGTYGIVYNPQTNTVTVCDGRDMASIKASNDNYRLQYITLLKILKEEGCESPLIVGLANGTVEFVGEGMPLASQVYERCSDDCAICLQRMDRVQGECVGLGCGHLFHGHCLVELAKHNANLLCPKCRVKSKLPDIVFISRTRNEYRLVANMMLSSCSGTSLRASADRYKGDPTEADYMLMCGTSGAELTHNRNNTIYASEDKDKKNRMFLIVLKNTLEVELELWPLPLRLEDVDHNVRSMLTPPCKERVAP